MNAYKIVDQKTWKRAAHCAVFRNCVEPAFCVTFDLDITAFYRKIKQRNLSFTFAMMYAVAKCANQIEEFRYRFLDGQVVLFEKIDTAFTYLDKQTELFKVVNVSFAGNMEEYCQTARLWLPFSVQAHLSFVDGLHIGRLAERLQSVLNNE